MDDLYFCPSVQRYHQALIELKEAKKAVYDKTSYSAIGVLLLSAICQHSGVTYRQLAEKTGIHVTEIPSMCKIMACGKFVRLKRRRTGKREYMVYVTEAGLRKHKQIMLDG